MTSDEFYAIDRLLKETPCRNLSEKDKCSYNGYVCTKCQAREKLRETYLKNNTVKGKIKNFFQQSKLNTKKVLLIRTLEAIRKT